MSRDRIKKLLGMTTAAGCTEAEAMVAAAKAAKLMEEMGLRRGDIEMDQDDIVIAAGLGAARAKLWPTIAACTNTSPITRFVDGEKVITYVGREPGPEVATYLHLVTDRAITRELSQFRATTWYKRRRTLKAKRQASSDFTLGMVARLQMRLRDLFDTSTDQDQIEAARAERDARFPDARKPVVPVRSHRYLEAALGGALAGEQVTLAHGVGSDKPALQIGGRP